MLGKQTHVFTTATKQGISRSLQQTVAGSTAELVENKTMKMHDYKIKQCECYLIMESNLGKTRKYYTPVII